MSDSLTKPIQQGATSAADMNDEPPSSPARRVDNSKQSM